MYLRDYLHDIPLRALKDIAGALKVPVEYGARIKLINAVDRAFWDGSLTGRLLAGLPEETRRLLSFLAFSYDTGVYEKTLLRKVERLGKINRESARAGIHSLIPCALAGGMRGEDTLYFCPRGVAEQVRKTLISSVVSYADSSVQVPLMTSPNLMEDIYSFLAEAYKEKAYLTLLGHVKKTFIERVFNGSLTCSDSLLRLSEDHRNSFVLDYLKTRSLVLFDHRKARATDRLGGWLRLSSTRRFQDIVAFAANRVFQDTPTVVAFTGILGELPAGAAFDDAKLAEFLGSWTMASGGHSRLETKVREMLTILYHLGMIAFREGRFIVTVAGERFFRNKPLPLDENTSDFFMVQPNFEVIVGPELNPRVRFRLELLADRKNRDMVLTYEITPDGITRARERGMSTDDIVRFFGRHSRTPLPQNVRFSIETWARSYGSIFFEKATLMRFRDESICTGVMHLAEVAPYIKERLGDTVLAVLPDHVPEIIDILKNAGYQPELQGAPSNDAAQPGEPFMAVSIENMLRETGMPDVHTDFIVPEDLTSNGSS